MRGCVQWNSVYEWEDFTSSEDRTRSDRSVGQRLTHWATGAPEQLYDNATSVVQMNGSIGEWFRTTVGVRQGCPLSPTLFNIFLERIMSDPLEEHDGKVSIGGRNITNLRFAYDIDALAEEEQELEALVESLDKTCTRY